MQQKPDTQWQQPNPQTGFSSFSQPGFSSFTQPGFQQSAPQLRHKPDFVSNDVVLETQESQRRKKKGKRVKGTETGGRSGPMAPKPWIHDEETALGRCYIDHSENKTKGNSQKHENFWKKINRKLARDDGLYRSTIPHISSTMFKMEGYEREIDAV
ncbi:hypothetical protein R6Q57_011944 [Mikania cordata]